MKNKLEAALAGAIKKLAPGVTKRIITEHRVSRFLNSQMTLGSHAPFTTRDGSEHTVEIRDDSRVILDRIH